MPTCDRISNCCFFRERMHHLPHLSQFMKSAYCDDQFHHCARYQVLQALGPGRVPADLFPSMSAQALELIQKG